MTTPSKTPETKKTWRGIAIVVALLLITIAVLAADPCTQVVEPSSSADTQ